jgi:DNA (cytosine-5)-methyltransferase 1
LFEEKIKMNRPTVVDLFAGVGGLSLGFEQAGFDVVAAVEIDPIHAVTHHFNFPKTAVLNCSVQKLEGSAILKAAGLKRGEVIVLIGGAPCQGFSLIGHRAMDDPRNSLVQDFVRLVSEIDPSFFVFENVKGLTVGQHKIFLSEIIQAFSDIGYQVCLPWQVLNASSYGVPQNRERLILMGARKGISLPDYPKPTSRLADTRSLFVNAIPTTPTCRDALGDLPEAESFECLNETDEVKTETWGTPSQYAREMRCLDDSSWHFGYRRLWEPSILTSSMRSTHTIISRRRFKETAPGSVEPISRFLKLSPIGVCNTLRAGTDASRGAFTSPRPIHYSQPRCITVREMARLHGFPDWFRFNETKWHGARQIGNSVPPPLARAVASQILAALGHKPTSPKGALALGDSSLLRMTVSSASDFLGTKSPSSKRDKKSGAKKRKQTEIEAQRIFQLIESADV